MYSIRLLILFVIIGLAAVTFAQEFDVRSFEVDLTDLAARRNEKLTVNDEPAALIKVITNISGMIFDSNQGIVDVEHKEAEYWVYVPPRERHIRLMAPEFLAKDVSLPEPARSHTVYQLVVTRKGMLAPITDLVRLTFRFKESDVFIRRGDQAPVSTIGNIAVFNIEKGEHSFRFIKEGFEEKILTLDVQNNDEIMVELTPGQITTPFQPPGFIVVTSDPSGAEVYLNEQRVGVTPYQNSHISGQYSLMLRDTDYHDHHQSFLLEAGVTMTIPTVAMSPRYGFYEVTSNPSGAEVLLNNRPVGRTPLSKTQISSDYHELTLRYSMYHEHREAFKIEDGDHKRLDVELKPAFGGLRITSDPSGARVTIAGREVGITPYENMQKPSGRYSVRLSLNLYGDATETIVISDGETAEHFIPMAQNFGSLNVTAEQSDIYIDGRKVGEGIYTANLTPGSYRLKAVRPQHSDAEQEIFIRLAQTENVTLVPVPKTGYLSIASEPFIIGGAEIWIDGELQEERTPAVIPLLEGNYELRVKMMGYIDAIRHIKIEEGKTLQKITVFTDEMGEEYIKEKERLAQEESMRNWELRQIEERQSKIREQELGKQTEQRQQTTTQLFQQEKYFSIHLSFTQMNLNTINFSRNIDNSLGGNIGLSYFANYWGAIIGAGYNSLGLKETAKAEFGFENIDVINYYACIGPKFRFSIFEFFVMAGYEGSWQGYGGNSQTQGEVFAGDMILNYGGMILPSSWRVGFRYSGNFALGLLDNYPPFSRHEFGLVYKF